MRSLGAVGLLRLGRSRRELALGLGLYERQVSRLVAGDSSPSFATRRRAWERFGVPLLDWEIQSSGHRCPVGGATFDDVKRATVRLNDDDEKRLENVRGLVALDGEPLALSALLAVLVRRGLDSLEAEIQGSEALRKAG